MTTDPTELRAAIRRLVCDPSAVAELLSTLENEYGQWLNDNDLMGAERRNGYGKLIDAFDEISEFADWFGGAVRAASREPASSLERASQAFIDLEAA